MRFIKLCNEYVDGKISYRFSGGEPMVLGERLFKLANKGFGITNVRPFILTAGKAMSKSWVLAAQNSAISHVFVSVENPIFPDPGAPNPKRIVHLIREYNTDKLPIRAGVCVIPTKAFRNLYDICAWFLDKLGYIPLICEINYDSYQRPTENEWMDLQKVLYDVVHDFGLVTPLNLFSSIIPEYAYGGDDPYLFELNLENSHNLSQDNLKNKIGEVIKGVHTISYQPLTCPQTECPWQDVCSNTKWYWQCDRVLSREEKLRDYCRYMNVVIDSQKIEDLLTRSVSEILPSKKRLKQRMLSGDRLKIYIGTDATGTSLHLGHATNYMILEKFRQLGHEVIFLIGDFTSRIGDPTDKTATRKKLTRDDVVENIKTWLDQIRPIINLDDRENPVKIMYNHDWFSKMDNKKALELAGNFTVQQMLERDMFEKRMNEKKPIYLHELFYPIMQGWDSVEIDVDVEMCGNDQKFNALVGRYLQGKYRNKEKFVFITTLLENPITKEKMMSKSMGTGIFLDFSAEEMFKGIINQADENIYQLFVDCTYLPMKEIINIRTKLEDKIVDPYEIKKKLALEIVSIYHGREKAIKLFEKK